MLWFRRLRVWSTSASDAGSRRHPGRKQYSRKDIMLPCKHTWKKPVTLGAGLPTARPNISYILRFRSQSSQPKSCAQRPRYSEWGSQRPQGFFPCMLASSKKSSIVTRQGCTIFTGVQNEFINHQPR